MTLIALDKAPWPWFGGKRQAAPTIWAALGDVEHYVEPFAGSLATLLCRPHTCNRTYFSETVNDADGLLVNAWRSIALHPDATVEAASWPVSEADLHARHLAILRWRRERNLEALMGDPAYCDPVIGGWWIWGQCSWIGSGWCSGRGPWIVGDDGRITKRRGAGGVHRKRPHVSNDGRGVNRPQTREEGVSRHLPHVSDDGQGVNHAGTREEGVSRQLPHVSSDGNGVNRPQMREEGVSDACDDEREFHPMTMPELRRWLAFLSARLRHVRILNGGWERAATSGVCLTLSVRQGGACGVFLDPPYADSADRAEDLYTSDSLTVAHDVRAWCLEHGADARYRIVLAGYAGEHGTDLEAAGWRAVEWFTTGFLRGGMAQQGDDGHQQGRERLWLSPHCIGAVSERQGDLFAGMGA